MEKNKTIQIREDNMEQNRNETKKTNKAVNFVRKNPLVSILLILLAGMFIWLVVSRNNAQRERNVLVKQYESSIDSIQMKNLEFVSRVFSWSVRSELLRENSENLNQLFNVFVRESNANLVQLVNLKDNIITISTDKQFEGNTFVKPDSVLLNRQTTLSDNENIKVCTPVMGFNEEIGLLVVETVK